MSKPLALVVLFFASAAWADIPAEHDVVVTGDLSLSYQHFTSSADDESIDLFRVSPTLDWLATRGLTIGVGLVFEHISQSSSEDRNDFGIIPRVGYMAELGPNAFIWPRFGIGYIRGATDISAIPISGSVSLNRVQLQVDLLICYSPVPHFFIGGGPVFHRDLSSSVSSDNGGSSTDAGKLTTFGIATVVGGYL